MPLIKNNKLTQDRWHYLADEQTPKASHNIVSLEYWLENKELLTSSSAPLGLLIQGSEAIENAAKDLGRFELIAIEFPSFADGRGYSLAKTLREQYKFAHEMRAIGDILPDQALYLTRVGFDSLELADDTLAKLALNKLDAFSVFYQKDLHVDEPASPS